MLPVKSEQLKTVEGSLLQDKQDILYREPVGFKATAFPNGEPETPLQHLAQTTSHVNRYIRQLDELYVTLLAEKIRSVDVQIAGRFQGLLNELLLLSSANKNRAETLMGIESAAESGSLSKATKSVLNEVIIHVAPEFSGRLTIYVEDGKLKAYRPYAPEEITATMGTFIELAERAGWKVTPPAGEIS
ncbi:hypothetical protein ACN09C_08135 [Serratia fonticola]|uniref:hypothetical protein n=1 Tax=Serratia fonticola TaxID=47917 RepID=UPI003B00317C|nr:hypothetical protein [Serratia fonticola]